MHPVDIATTAVIHESAHPEPWIFALCDQPDMARAYDDGLRWGVEATFSDLRTGGFNLEYRQIQRSDRLDHRGLMLSLALCWLKNKRSAEQNLPRHGEGIMREV